jgi:hypothetical protein
MTAAAAGSCAQSAQVLVLATGTVGVELHHSAQYYNCISRPANALQPVIPT